MQPQNSVKSHWGGNMAVCLRSFNLIISKFNPTKPLRAFPLFLSEVKYLLSIQNLHTEWARTLRKMSINHQHTSEQFSSLWNSDSSSSHWFFFNHSYKIYFCYYFGFFRFTAIGSLTCHGPLHLTYKWILLIAILKAIFTGYKRQAWHLLLFIVSVLSCDWLLASFLWVQTYFFLSTFKIYFLSAICRSVIFMLFFF